MVRKVINRIIYAMIKAPLGYGKPVATDVWDEQFEKDVWDKLGSIDEMAHYMVIAGYVLHENMVSGRSLSILDVGCGDGQTCRYLTATGTSDYTGIDISAKAIAKAKYAFGEVQNFIVSDFESWQTDYTYDIIIFNESLYYSVKPTETVLKYGTFLRGNGKLIISMCDYGNHMKIFKNLCKIIRHVHSSLVRNNKGQIWNIHLFEKF